MGRSVQFPERRENKSAKNGQWIDGKFDASIDPKDGYAVGNCVDPGEKRVL